MSAIQSGLSRRDLLRNMGIIAGASLLSTELLSLLPPPPKRIWNRAGTSPPANWRTTSILLMVAVEMWLSLPVSARWSSIRN